MLPGWTVRKALSTRESWLAEEETASVTVCSGFRYRPEATSPNCRSRSTITTPIGATLPSPIAMFVAIVVLPTPPLGEKTPITRPLALSGCLATEVRLRVANDWQARSSSTRIWAGSAAGLRMSRMPARMASRTKFGSASPTRMTLSSGSWTSNTVARRRASSTGTSGPRIRTSGRSWLRLAKSSAGFAGLTNAKVCRPPGRPPAKAWRTRASKSVLGEIRTKRLTCRPPVSS